MPSGRRSAPIISKKTDQDARSHLPDPPLELTFYAKADQMDELKHLKRRKSRRQHEDLFRVRRRFWDVQLATSKRTAVTGFTIGLALGCILGGTMTFLP